MDDDSIGSSDVSSFSSTDEETRNDDYDEYHNDAHLRQAPSYSQRSVASQRSRISMSSRAELRISDQAFQMTASLVVSYLSPKMKQNETSYYLDRADTIYLDTVVPQEIRPGFVQAVASRIASIAIGKPCKTESLVKECQRLGLGQKNCFLLGGGELLDDGRLLVQVRCKCYFSLVSTGTLGL